MKTAVLVSTMGGPKDLASVRPFLFNLFNDPSILRLPPLFRWGLAQILSRAREKKAQAIYAKMGGSSPILENTRKQAQALENRLAQEGAYRVFVGMSYSAPTIEEAMRDIKAYNPDRLVLLPLYPQYSTTTTASVFREAKKAVAENGISCPVEDIHAFFSLEGFLEAWTARLRETIGKTGKEEKPFVFFSAHGLPEKIVKDGDPYPDQCALTARAIAQKAGLDDADWLLCYQSRVGPAKWIGPDIGACLEKEALRHRAIIVVPLSFVCEHSETLVELGMEYRGRAMEAGASSYHLVPTPFCDASFIDGLAQLVRASEKEREPVTA